MRIDRATTLAGALAILAFASTPAFAQTIDAGAASATVGSTSGTSSAEAGDPNGGGSAATGTATGGAATGGTGPTEAIVTLGGANTASGTGPATGTVTLGSLAAGDPYGSGVITLGPNPANGGTTGTITLGTPPASGVPGGPVGPGGLTQNQLATVLANLNDSDVQDLKKKCADVLGNPAAFDAGTIGVCQPLATL
jgi:hypothetical protein